MLPVLTKFSALRRCHQMSGSAMLRLAKITTVVINAVASTAGKPATVLHRLRDRVIEGMGKRPSSVLEAAIKSLIGEMARDNYLLRCSSEELSPQRHRGTEP